MKNFIFAAFLILTSLISIGAMANTTPPVSVPVRTVYNNSGPSVGLGGAGSVGTVHWVPLLNLTAKGVKGLQIQDTSTYTMEIGVATYGAAADSEVSQFLIPLSAANTFYPMAIAAGMRISIRGKGSVAITGENDTSIFYY